MLDDWTISVGAPVAAYRERQWQTFTALGAGALGLAALAFGGAFVMAQRISRPVTRLEEVFTHIDQFDPKALPEAEALLFRVVLGLTEASQAVKIFGQPRVPYAPFPHSVAMEWVGYQPH